MDVLIIPRKRKREKPIFVNFNTKNKTRNMKTKPFWLSLYLTNGGVGEK